MNSSESLALRLGDSAVKSAVIIWLNVGNRSAETSLKGLIETRVADGLDQRKFLRSLEGLVDTSADRFSSIMDSEFRSLPDLERNAAVDIVIETLSRAELSSKVLFEADFDARTLYGNLRRMSDYLNVTFQLSEAGVACCNVLLMEACRTIVEIATKLPNFDTGGFQELLHREKETLRRIEDLLERLPKPSVDDPAQLFEASYRRALVSRLDRLELVGAAFPPATRILPLSATYTNMHVRLEGRTVPVDWAFAECGRLVLSGEAGSGKTTLMSWLAVMSAREAFTGPLARWNDLLPFYLPMSSVDSRELPYPSQFASYLLPELADVEIAANVEQRLRSGRALLLIDGIDELSKRDRGRVRVWLGDIVTTYPDVRVVVSSRPAALPANWLSNSEFVSCDVLPLDADSIRTLVRQWFLAVDPDGMVRQALRRSEELLGEIDGNPALRELASSPLMCALLCAVSYTHGRLPLRRTELYRTFCDTLIERRDSERGIPDSYVLSRTDTFAILGDLALWMLLNEVPEVGLTRIRPRIARVIRRLQHDTVTPDEAIAYLLERSGILRQSAQDHVQFIHESLQSYFAAREVIEEDAVTLLIQHADEGRWRDVLVAASGEAGARQADELLRALLRRSRSEPGHASALLEVARECLVNVRRLDPDLRDELEAAIGQLDLCAENWLA